MLLKRPLVSILALSCALVMSTHATAATTTTATTTAQSSGSTDTTTTTSTATSSKSGTSGSDSSSSGLTEDQKVGIGVGVGVGVPVVGGGIAGGVIIAKAKSLGLTTSEYLQGLKAGLSDAQMQAADKLGMSMEDYDQALKLGLSDVDIQTAVDQGMSVSYIKAGLDSGLSLDEVSAAKQLGIAQFTFKQDVDSGLSIDEIAAKKLGVDISDITEWRSEGLSFTQMKSEALRIGNDPLDDISPLSKSDAAGFAKLSREMPVHTDTTNSKYDLDYNRAMKNYDAHQAKKLEENDPENDVDEASVAKPKQPVEDTGPASAAPEGSDAEKAQKAEEDTGEGGAPKQPVEGTEPASAAPEGSDALKLKGVDSASSGTPSNAGSKELGEIKENIDNGPSGDGSGAGESGDGAADDFDPFDAL